MKTISLVVEHKEFKIGVDEKYASQIEDVIFGSLKHNESNSIKDLIALVLEQRAIVK